MCTDAICTGLRVLVVDIYYPAVVEQHYAERPGLSRRGYDEQLASLLDTSFGTSDAYSHHLREAGHTAAEIVVNCMPLQAQWARENGVKAVAPRRLATRAPWLPGAVARQHFLHSVARAQVDAFEPDVIYSQDLWLFSAREIAEFRRRGIFTVAQVGSQPPPDNRIERFDLITTSFPHFVPRLRERGVEVEYLPLAFDDRVLGKLRSRGLPASADDARDLRVTFAGGVHTPEVHRGGTALLERLCTELDLQLWGYIKDRLRADSPILPRHHGEAWGLDMYSVLARSQITVNRHGDIAEDNANNMRLFEATGVGAMLMTEEASNLGELFDPGVEVVPYRDADDLLEKARHYLEHEAERRAIARAGQARTLADHTYRRRMQQLAAMLEARV